MEEFLSQSGSNTLSHTRTANSLTPNKEDELELKHRIIQGGSTQRKSSQKFDSATPSESSYHKEHSESEDDEQMEFDDDVGDELEKSGAPIIPVSVNLEIERQNRRNKNGLHTKTNKTDNCGVRKGQKYIALQLSSVLIDSS